MAIFGKILDFVSGGVGKTIVDTVTARFPARMSEQERRELEAAIVEATRQYELELIRLANEQEKEFNERIRDLEGTASDLTQAGWPGRVVLFLRGLQRPTWGFAVLYMDLMVFSGAWNITGSGGAPDATATEAIRANAAILDLQSAFWVINLLVLGFLFGERAIKNAMPFFRGRFQSRAAGDRPVG